MNAGELGRRGHKLDFLVAETYGEEETSILMTADLWKKNISGYIGPQETCIHEGRMAAAFNLPMISYVSSLFSLLLSLDKESRCASTRLTTSACLRSVPAEYFYSILSLRPPTVRYPPPPPPPPAPPWRNFHSERSEKRRKTNRGKRENFWSPRNSSVRNVFTVTQLEMHLVEKLSIRANEFLSFRFDPATFRLDGSYRIARPPPCPLRRPVHIPRDAS